MMSQLRWSLLILGVVFFAGLTLWELRRPRQARGPKVPAEPTRSPEPPHELPLEPPLEPTLEPTLEPPLELPEIHALHSLTGASLPVVELLEDIEALPVLEPASPAAVVTAPEEPGEREGDEGAPQPAVDAEYEFAAEAEELVEAPEAAAAPEPGAPEMLSELPGAPPPRVDWPPDEERRIVALRLVAQQPERFAGRSLRQALAAEGFVLGRFAIFHKADETQRAILSAASLTRPGTFDPQTMDSQHFGGLSLFAVLPGPLSPPQVFEELVTTARNLNERLCGVLQDEGGTPLTPTRIASLREHLASEALS